MADVLGIDRRINKTNELYMRLRGGQLPEIDKTIPNYFKYAQVLGEIKQSNGKKSYFNCERYKYFLYAPFDISNKCCDVMKKKPIHKYSKETGRKGITAQMASESMIRTQKWLQNGCNAFNATNPISNPMSFWTEQDVLLYCKLKNIKLASVYGDIVSDIEMKDDIDYWNLAIFDEGRPTLSTTGVNRTGCFACAYGAHLEKDGEERFLRLKQTHPKMYDYLFRKPYKKEIINPENGELMEITVNGLNYKEIIDWINEHDPKIDIKY